VAERRLRRHGDGTTAQLPRLRFLPLPEFLQAEFRVTVKDSIFGALALQAFAEMVRKSFGKHYRSGQIDFEMSQEAGSLHSRALQDVMEHAFCA